ncbi:hypothetical protein PLUTO_00750 [Luteibacter phage vB_LflM-Pluto]|uniref:Uncharacterized protein n=1 Tax=Luteibacter phage vB_LflM-Pluto TaxID=2948611 RepID=A0A9E7SLZ8_9CAUD|nr:hypothetical protein PLUTO_00750 [Luteibacter phage vB_LflM-Pluto]
MLNFIKRLVARKELEKLKTYDEAVQVIVNFQEVHGELAVAAEATAYVRDVAEGRRSLAEAEVVRARLRYLMGRGQ